MNKIPWIEKYKPTNINVFTKNNILLKKNTNHCIFYGQSGIGKTTYINMLIESIFRKEDISKNVLILNASDERGIDTVRYKIKNFAQQSIYKKYKYKLIVLDEADNLTYDAQNALRRIIEIYTNTTRFFLVCNYEKKIIEPIKSRCNVVKFNNFNKKYIMDYLKNIIFKENIDKQYEKFLNKIINFSNNDLRKSLIYLELLIKIDISLLNSNLMYDLFGKINQVQFLKKLKKNKNISDVYKNINLFNKYTLKDIINVILNIVLNLNIDECKKFNIIILLSEIDNIKNKDINYDIVIIKLLKEFINI